jgi:hypothetical protein
MMLSRLLSIPILLALPSVADLANAPAQWAIRVGMPRKWVLW